MPQHSAAPRTGLPARSSCIAYAGDRPTVQVVGRADRAVTTQVGGWIRGLVAGGVQHLVIDVSAAVDCDGQLLTVLSRTRTQLRSTNGSLVLVGVQLPHFLAALPYASLDEVFIIYDTVRRESVSRTRHRSTRGTPSRFTTGASASE